MTENRKKKRSYFTGICDKMLISGGTPEKRKGFPLGIPFQKRKPPIRKAVAFLTYPQRENSRSQHGFFFYVCFSPAG
jgi:hypothetical protein